MNYEINQSVKIRYLDILEKQ